VEARDTAPSSKLANGGRDRAHGFSDRSFDCWAVMRNLYEPQESPYIDGLEPNDAICAGKNIEV
jgi:hypothetical protein